MAFRDDVTVQWNLSPRIIRVAAPSTEISLQDLHDTLAELEAHPENMVYPRIIESTGKQTLGAGVFVGITSTLLDARLAFEARKQVTSSGTITTSDVDGRTLIDVSASFITDGVQPGAWIVNRTDNSRCSVLVTQSETQLLTDVLGNGITNQFVLNDQYFVQNVTQCNIAGGNIVAVNSASVNIDPILPTEGTQVIRTSAASATLQELHEIQFAAFNNSVTFDQSSSYSGTDYPVGTGLQPVNNLDDALIILNDRGFDQVRILGNAYINNDGNYQNISFFGQSEVKSTVELAPSANTTNCEFYNSIITGSLDGGNLIKNCIVANIDYFNGIIEDCTLRVGTIKLLNSAQARFFNCRAGYTVGQTDTPTIDLGVSGSNTVFRNYNGSIRFKNINDSTAVTSIDMNSGTVYLDLVLDSTGSWVTGSVQQGVFALRGIGNAYQTSGFVPLPTGLLQPRAGLVIVNDLLNKTAVASAAGYVSIETVTMFGSTSSSILTPLIQDDEFYTGMYVVVFHPTCGGAACRRVNQHKKTNGEIIVDPPLPFTPTVGAKVTILNSFDVGGGIG